MPNTPMHRLSRLHSRLNSRPSRLFRLYRLSRLSRLNIYCTCNAYYLLPTILHIEACYFYYYDYHYYYDDYYYYYDYYCYMLHATNYRSYSYFCLPLRLQPTTSPYSSHLLLTAPQTS